VHRGTQPAVQPRMFTAQTFTGSIVTPETSLSLAVDRTDIGPVLGADVVREGVVVVVPEQRATANLEVAVRVLQIEDEEAALGPSLQVPRLSARGVQRDPQLALVVEKPDGARRRKARASMVVSVATSESRRSRWDSGKSVMAGSLPAEFPKGQDVLAVRLTSRCVGQQRGFCALGLELESALRTADSVHAVEQELAAHRALQAGTAQDRGQLLIERPVQGSERHSERNTPVTLPRIWTWSA
jgi:hypothetical protein